jgi:RecA/RadA recombinase
MHKPISGRTTAQVLERLAAEVRRIEGLHHPTASAATTTGCSALDRLLPEGGLRRGTLVEWLSAAPGSGAATLALIAAREACRSGGVLAVLDTQRGFYPPGAAALQVEPQ